MKNRCDFNSWAEYNKYLAPKPAPKKATTKVKEEKEKK